MVAWGESHKAQPTICDTAALAAGVRALNTDEALKGRRFRPSDCTWASGEEKRPRPCAAKRAICDAGSMPFDPCPGFCTSRRPIHPAPDKPGAAEGAYGQLSQTRRASLLAPAERMARCCTACEERCVHPTRIQAAESGINGGVRGLPSPGGLWRCQRPARGKPWCRSAPSFRRRAHPQDLTSGHLPSDSGRKACSPGTVAMIL